MGRRFLTKLQTHDAAFQIVLTKPNRLDFPDESALTGEIGAFPITLPRFKLIFDSEFLNPP